MTDEFIKLTPGKRKILEYLDKLRPFEEIRIVADKDGKIDTFFYESSVRIRVSGDIDINIKDIWKK